MSRSLLPSDPELARRTAPVKAAGTAGPADTTIWSAEYWAERGDVPLDLARGRLRPPKTGVPPPAS